MENEDKNSLKHGTPTFRQTGNRLARARKGASCKLATAGKKIIILLCAVALTLTAFAQTDSTKLYQVIDPDDDWVNVRAGAGTNYEVAKKIKVYSFVSRNFDKQIINGWIPIEYSEIYLSTSYSGYIHESRLEPYDYTFLIFLPDKSTTIDKKRVEQIRGMVYAIDSMPLKCDTILYKYDNDAWWYREFRGIYFDKEGRLRKYSRKDLGEGSNSEASAYYDGAGNLVYFIYSSESTCDGADGCFYVNDGKIVDFMGTYDCGCCEDKEAFTEEIMRTKRPVVGSTLTKTMNMDWPLANFIYSKTLLSKLKSENYSGYEEFE